MGQCYERQNCWRLNLRLTERAKTTVKQHMIRRYMEHDTGVIRSGSTAWFGREREETRLNIKEHKGFNERNNVVRRT